MDICGPKFFFFGPTLGLTGYFGREFKEAISGAFGRVSSLEKRCILLEIDFCNSLEEWEGPHAIFRASMTGGFGLRIFWPLLDWV